MAVTNAWGAVIARHSGRTLDVAGGSPDPGAVLQQWQMLPDHPNQRFRFGRLNDGFSRIRVIHTNKVLGVSMGSADRGAGVVQGDWHGGDNQRFALDDAGGGLFRVRAKRSGKVLDVVGGSRDNGARVIQWDNTGGPEPAVEAHSAHRLTPWRRAPNHAKITRRRARM